MRAPHQGDVYELRASRDAGHVIMSPDESNALMKDVVVVPLILGEHDSPFCVPCRFDGRDVKARLDVMHTIPVDHLGRRLGRLDAESLAILLGGFRELFGD